MAHVTNTPSTVHCLDTLEQNVLCLQVDAEAAINVCSVRTQFKWYTHYVQQCVQHLNDALHAAHIHEHIQYIY